MKISKKFLAILSAVVLLLVIAGLVYYFSRQKVELPLVSTPASNNEPVFVQEFMTVAEKKALSMPEDLEVQILRRDETGEPMTFKIIKSDADILTTNSIPAIRPEKE